MRGVGKLAKSTAATAPTARTARARREAEPAVQVAVHEEPGALCMETAVVIGEHGFLDRLGAQVKATVLAHGRGDKVRIFKLRRRKHYRKSQGHRQNYTEIEIVGITS